MKFSRETLRSVRTVVRVFFALACIGAAGPLWARTITIQAHPAKGAASFQIQWLETTLDTQGPVENVKAFPVTVEVPGKSAAFRLRALTASGLAGAWSRPYNIPGAQKRVVQKGLLLRITSGDATWRIARVQEAVQVSKEAGPEFYAGGAPFAEGSLKEGTPLVLSRSQDGTPSLRITFQSGGFFVRSNEGVRVEFLAPVSCVVRPFPSGSGK